MRTFFILVILVFLGLVGGVARMSDDPRPAEVPPRQVSVRLLGPAAEIAGIKVPDGVAEINAEYLRCDAPTDLTIELPDGKSMRAHLLYVSLHLRYGTVVDVHMLPLAESVPYKEAVAELSRWMGAMGIEPDDAMKEDVAAWPDDVPGARPGFYPHTYRAEMELSKDTLFLVKLRPANDGGWFLALNFAAGIEKRLAIQPPTANDQPEGHHEK